MVEHAVLSPPRAGANGNGAPRTLNRHRGLPSGRAVAGGLLVAVAAIGIFAAWRGAAAGPSTSYVVAARRLAVGTRLSIADLRVAKVELPASLRRHAFADRRALVGATVLGPLEGGELVQASNVTAERDRPRQQVSFSIEASRALNGSIAPGERVDVLGTYGSGGGDSWTAVIASNVLVADISSAGSSLNAGRALVLTLSLDDRKDVLAVTHAARSGTITIARAGLAGGATAYRPTPPERGRATP